MGRIKVEKTDNATKKQDEVKKSIDKNRRTSLSTINIENLQIETINTLTTSNTFERFVHQIKNYKGTELVPSCDINEICLNIFAAMREIFVGDELKLKLMQFCDYLTDPKTLILYIDILEGNVDVNLVLSIMYPVDAEPMLSSTPLEYVFDAEIHLTNQNRVQTKWRHLVEVDKQLKKQKVVAWSESAMIECLDKMRSLTEVPCFVQDATSLVSTPASSNSDSRCDDIREDFWTHLKRQKAYSVFEIIPYVFDENESKPPKTIQQWSLFSESMRKQVYKLSVPYELDNLVSHIVLMYMRPKPNESLNEKNVLYDDYKISISRNKESFLVFFFLKTNIV